MNYDDTFLCDGLTHDWRAATVTRQFSYADAAKLLGAPPPFLKMLDQISAAGLLGASVGAPSAILSLFDARSEAMRIGASLIASLREKLSQKNHYERVELLQAAHSIIALTAYFESFGHLDLPVNLDDLKLTKHEQIYLAGGHVIEGRDDIVSMIVSTEISAPSPTVPYEATRIKLLKFYEDLSSRLLKFIYGLRIREGITSNAWTNLINGLSEASQLALEKYDGHFRRLAGEFVEFFIWANLQDHQATRKAVLSADRAQHQRLDQLFQTVDSLRTGLAGVEKLLNLAAFGNANFARSSLAILCRAELDWPIIDKRVLEAQPQIEFPRLVDGYVNPSGRSAEITDSSRPGEDLWWRNIQPVKDIQTTLAGLISKTDSPTVVLGQPGSGKSLLTRVLAARASEAGVLALRVELRHVQADASIQRQIEEGIYHLLGERTPWPDLIRDAKGAPRLILLDGLDELLQTSQVERADYLELVQDFQQRENTIGRPTAIIVTSRTVVAARTRFPENSCAVLLDPFTDEQIELWLAQWNAANRRYLAETGLPPLSARDAVRQGDLARQPLLLLMLALYDMDDNRLQATATQLASADLYERLLQRFARREAISRDRQVQRALPETLDPAIERELQRLSVIACGMFNRARQWITIDEVCIDFDALLSSRIADKSRATTSRFQERLSEADVAVGRFFFVYESRLHGNATRHSYEFLHPTFGEYLVGRLVLRAARDYCDRIKLEAASSAVGYSRPDDGLLFAILSFELLTARSHLLRFIKEQLRNISVEEKGHIRLALCDVLQEALHHRADRGFLSYYPKERDSVSRAATFSANLVLLIVLLAEEPLSTDELFGEGSDSLNVWRRHAMLWKSQLGDSSEWNSFIRFFSVTRDSRPDGSRYIRLSQRGKGEPLFHLDISWLFGGSGASTGVEVSPRRIIFMNTEGISDLGFIAYDEFDLILSMIYPVYDGGAGEFVPLVSCPESQKLVTATGELLNLIEASFGADVEDLSEAYMRCASLVHLIGMSGFEFFGKAVVSFFEADSDRLSTEFIEKWLSIVDMSSGEDVHGEVERLRAILV